MKPYGQKSFHHNHPDNHPLKPFVNWWEAEMLIKSKKSARQEKIVLDEEIGSWSGKGRPVKKCEGCVYYELVVRLHPFCRLFGSRLVALKDSPALKYCWENDPEKETMRIESKSW